VPHFVRVLCWPTWFCWIPPGTGDPELLQEIARDFLPICDGILFLFSSASLLDRWIDGALSHPEGARTKGGAKRRALENKNVFHFRTGLTTTAGCSHGRIMVDVPAESMVGGSIFHREMIPA
jgi:hypothetical protein